MDINKDSKQLNPDAGLGELLAKTDLLDLHWHHFPSRPTPPMHQRSSKTIDVILGSLHVAQALIHAWYLPFGEPIPLLGDHHALGIELDINILLGHKLLIHCTPSTKELIAMLTLWLKSSAKKWFHDALLTTCLIESMTLNNGQHSMQ